MRIAILHSELRASSFPLLFFVFIFWRTTLLMVAMITRSGDILKCCPEISSTEHNDSVPIAKLEQYGVETLALAIGWAMPANRLTNFLEYMPTLVFADLIPARKPV